MTIIKINSLEDFENLISKNTNKYIFCYCWTNWCSYCNKIMNILDRLSKKYVDKITFISFNIDKNSSCKKHIFKNIDKVPTYLLLNSSTLEIYKEFCCTVSINVIDDILKQLQFIY